jgi:hypothetical protein
MSYDIYTGREELFGLGYPGDGETINEHDEALQIGSIGRLIGAMLGALGCGIYRGGVGAIAGGSLVISELGWAAGEVLVPGAVIEDSLGAVPVYHAEETLEPSAFAEGMNYVHVQVGETARTDLSCGYYVDTSDVPAPDALLVCAVTVTAGVITAVDNSVRAAPAIAARIPWAGLVRVFGGTETLESLLNTILGAAYLGAAPPDAVHTRLAALEALVGALGGGTGATVYWWLLPMLPGDATTIPQWVRTITDALAARVTALEAAGSGGTATTVVEVEEWDENSHNLGLLCVALTHHLPDIVSGQRNVATVVRDHYGHGDGEDEADYVGAGSEW